ncbi:embryonic polarity protein dorsal [Zeugodacus cucurbitae]|uniref:embryonic polarity protein dorsal n=1 Tax=Zeugodacus cucurbitae TaxID=28588 RepID=UPI0023D95C79|nr:embryonic polarity protein dorsal [Zeugodacus cucurbitae]
MDSYICMNQFNDFMDQISPSMSLMEQFNLVQRQNPPTAEPPQQKSKPKQKPKPVQTKTSAALKKQLAEPNRKYANAYVKIVEQPASKAVRFRYECEGRSAGSIPGVNSTLETRTYPTIEIVGYKGRSVCVVSCVTKDPPFKPHPHNLVGKEGCKHGVYTFSVNEETMRGELCNLGIQCVKKKDIEASLKARKDIRVDPFKTGFSHAMMPGTLNINAVRLCFQVFIQGENGHFTVPLKPVVSEPIYDKKSKLDLVIIQMCSSATVLGNTHIMLLCEKVAKEDIAVRFFEEKNGVVVWQAYGDFLSSDVHKQTSIRLKTPKYHKTDITEPVQVLVQLLRPSDGAVSEPWEFKYEPIDSDEVLLKRKCRRIGLTMASLQAEENQTNSERIGCIMKSWDATNKPAQDTIMKDETPTHLDMFYASSEMTPSPEPLSPITITNSSDSSTSPSPYGKVTEILNLETGAVDVHETLNVETTPSTLENNVESQVYTGDQQPQQQQHNLDQLLLSELNPIQPPVVQQLTQQQQQHQSLPLQLQVQQKQQLPQSLHQTQQQQQTQQPLHPHPQQMPMQLQQVQQQPLLQQKLHMPQHRQQPQQQLHPQPQPISMQQQQVSHQSQLQQQLQVPQPPQMLQQTHMSQQQQQPQLMPLQQQQQQLNPQHFSQQHQLPYQPQHPQQLPLLGNSDMMNWEEKFASVLAFAAAALSSNPFNLQHFLTATANSMTQSGQWNFPFSNMQQQPLAPPQQQQQYLSPQQLQPAEQQEDLSKTQFQQQSNVTASSNDDTLVGDDDANNASVSQPGEEASTISHLLNLDSDQLVQISCDDTLLGHAINDELEIASLTISV